MKTTIEEGGATVSLETKDPSTEAAVRNCYLCLIAVGHHPQAVADWMVEVGESEGAALRGEDGE